MGIPENTKDTVPAPLTPSFEHAMSHFGFLCPRIEVTKFAVFYIGDAGLTKARG